MSPRPRSARCLADCENRRRSRPRSSAPRGPRSAPVAQAPPSGRSVRHGDCLSAPVPCGSRSSCRSRSRGRRSPARAQCGPRDGPRAWRWRASSPRARGSRLPRRRRTRSRTAGSGCGRPWLRRAHPARIPCGRGSLWVPWWAPCWVPSRSVLSGHTVSLDRCDEHRVHHRCIHHDCIRHGRERACVKASSARWSWFARLPSGCYDAIQASNFLPSSSPVRLHQVL